MISSTENREPRRRLWSEASSSSTPPCSVARRARLVRSRLAGHRPTGRRPARTTKKSPYVDRRREAPWLHEHGALHARRRVRSADRCRRPPRARNLELMPRWRPRRVDADASARGAAGSSSRATERRPWIRAGANRVAASAAVTCGRRMLGVASSTTASTPGRNAIRNARGRRLPMRYDTACAPPTSRRSGDDHRVRAVGVDITDRDLVRSGSGARLGPVRRLRRRRPRAQDERARPARRARDPGRSSSAARNPFWTRRPWASIPPIASPHQARVDPAHGVRRSSRAISAGT